MSPVLILIAILAVVAVVLMGVALLCTGAQADARAATLAGANDDEADA